MMRVVAAARAARAVPMHRQVICSYHASSSSAVAPEVLEKASLVPTYSSDGVRFKPGVTFTHGKGSKLYGDNGRTYVDWAAGIAVCALGHADEELQVSWWCWKTSFCMNEWSAETNVSQSSDLSVLVSHPLAQAIISREAGRLLHTSNLFHTQPPLDLARALLASSRVFKDDGRVFLCNSGTEANEAALKFARRYALASAVRSKAAKLAAAGAAPAPAWVPGCKSVPPTRCCTSGGMCGCWPQAADGDIAAAHKTGLVAFKGSFHGRSMGSLAVTHKPAIRQPYGPFPGDVKFAHFNDLEGAAAAVSSTTAAIIVEPTQGEGGIVPATPAFMVGLRRLADAHGALLIVDEVQCGLGRTGRLWAHEAYGAEAAPDMLTVAKPLANGLPIGATLVRGAVAAAVTPGDHGTTYGGNPLIAAAALSVLRRVADPTFLAATRARGARLLDGLRALQKRFPAAIAEVRGTPDGGLFAGVQLHVPPKALTTLAGDKGLLLITAGENALRICPPLNIPEEDVDFGLRVLGECFAELGSAMHGPKAA